MNQKCEMIAEKIDECFLIWNGNDAMKLRENRILGNLIGISSDEKKSDKVSLNGLPLALSLYELMISVEKGWIKDVVSKEILNVHIDSSLYDSFSIPKTIKDEKTISFPYLSSYDARVSIDIQEMFKIMKKRIDSYPLKYVIFCDLWEKGYYVQVGNKMGVDFIIYDSDPLVVHASSLVKVLDWRESLSSLDFVMISRISNNSKKNLILASMDENENVKYVTSNWVGVS